MFNGVVAIRDVELTLSRVPGHTCKLVSSTKQAISFHLVNTYFCGFYSL